MFKYTKLSENELVSYLGKLRRISSMSDEDALLEVDEFIYNLALRGIVDKKQDDVDDVSADQEDFAVDDRSWLIDNSISSVQRSIKNARYEIKQNTVQEWPIEVLKKELDNISAESDVKANSKLFNLINEGLDTVKEMEKSWSVNILDTTLNREIHSVNSVKSILKELERAEERLAKLDCFDDSHALIVYQSKVRCSKHRANKKLDNAEVADRLGDAKKASKLKVEAQVVFEQDWLKIFGNSEYPQLS